MLLLCGQPDDVLRIAVPDGLSARDKRCVLSVRFDSRSESVG